MDDQLPPLNSIPSNFEFSGNVRTYYVAAEQIEWNYAPSGWYVYLSHVQTGTRSNFTTGTTGLAFLLQSLHVPQVLDTVISLALSVAMAATLGRKRSTKATPMLPSPSRPSKLPPAASTDLFFVPKSTT